MIRSDRVNKVGTQIVEILNKLKMDSGSTKETSTTVGEDMTALLQVMIQTLQENAGCTDPDSPKYVAMNKDVVKAMAKLVIDNDMTAADMMVILLTFIQITIKVLSEDEDEQAAVSGTVH